MRTAIAVCLLVVSTASGQDKKPEKITPENIEVGKVGTIDRLEVERVFPDDKRIIAQFATLRVLIADYPTKGIGKGKILPSTQVWLVKTVIDTDGSGNGLDGCYLIEPVKKK